jgi:hypothetical protein
MSTSGSRGLIRVSKNPGCLLQAAMALETKSEPQFYRDVTGQDYPGEYGERGSARRRGSKFESNLFDNNAALLREAVAPLFGLDAGAMWVRNFAEEIPGPPSQLSAKRFVRMREILQDLKKGNRVPDLLIEPQLIVPSRGMKPDIFVRPDFMVLSPSQNIYMPGELKSFITRENVAEPGDKDLTRRQAGAQVLGLRALMERVSPGWSAEVPNKAIFVFATPYGLAPAKPFIEPIDSAVHEVDRALDTLGEVQKLLAKIRNGQDVPLKQIVDEIPIKFQESCYSTCIMAGVCEKRHAGTVRTLGDNASDILGADTTLERVIKLLSGTAAPNETETVIVAHLKDAAKTLGIDEEELVRRLA